MSTAAKVVALVVFLGAIAGATFAVQNQLGSADAITAASVRGEPLHERLNATSGHSVTFAILVTNRGASDVDVVARLAGDGLSGASGPATVAAGSNLTLFVPLDVASAAPGSHDLALRLEEPDGTLLRESQRSAALAVLAPAPGFGDGITASVVYVGRLADGTVFNTNDGALLPHNFAKASIYRPSTPGAFSVTGGPDAQVVEGFYEILVGMQAGESRTMTIPPEKAYGPAANEETIARTETLERRFELPIRTDSVARETFDGYVAQTNQGSDWEINSVFRFEQGANQWPYQIVGIDENEVHYRLAVTPGERYTLYPFWTNASEVVSVNATAALFRTTPTTNVGEALTMRAYWPEMTTLVSVTEDEIVVRHDPPVGFKYAQPGSQTQAAADATVKSVSDDEIVVTTPSGNPLAGQNLTFDVYVESLTT